MEFNRLIPELSVSNIEKSVEFYTAIGFKIEYTRPGFAFLSFQGSQLMLDEGCEGDWKTGELEQPYGRGINFQIEVDNITPLAESLKRNNHALQMEPTDNWYRKDDVILGSREFLVLDPDGYLLRFSQDIGEKSV